MSDQPVTHTPVDLLHICTQALVVFEIITFQMFDLKNIVKVTEYNVRSDAVQWRI